jgi:hypothetical protein
MNYIYGLTDADLVEYKAELKKLVAWLKSNQHLRRTKEFEDKYAEAEGLYETIHNL